MTYNIDAIYDHGVFCPLQPLAMPDGTRVHLHFEEQRHDVKAPTTTALIVSPRLAHPEQTAEFEMEVHEVPDARV
jgi:predicted DNA-binding antitoxin AbrB/MazE fold protein